MADAVFRPLEALANRVLAFPSGLEGHMKVYLCAAVMAAMMWTQALADYRAKEFLDVYGSGEHVPLRMYLRGLEDGMSWANAKRNHEGERRMYCVPPKMAITVEQEVDILKKYIQTHPEKSSSYLGLVLLDAMVDTFPCPY